MARRSDSEIDQISRLPWWLCLLFAAVVYVGMRFGLPRIELENPMLRGVLPALVPLAWAPALLFVLASIGSIVRTRSRRRLLERQRGIETIRALTWLEFEHLVGEAYRRQGHAVSGNDGAGPDGGVDLTLRRGGETVLVQCKRWRAAKPIGVPVVRELLGAMTAAGATGGIVVGTGGFTAPAIAFARGNGIELVDGDSLAAMIALVQSGGEETVAASAAAAEPTAVETTTSAVRSASGAPPPSVTSQCPTCGSEMIERVARRGTNAGNRFLGCSRFPACRGVRSLP